MKHGTIIQKVEDIAAAQGVTPQGLLRKLTGNPYLWGRLPAKAAALDDLERKLDEYAEEGLSDG